MNFDDTLMELLDHYLGHLDEASRIQVLGDLKAKVIERYEYECSDPLEEFSKEISSVEGLDKDDMKVLGDIYELLKAKKWSTAVRKYEKVDTVVREHMPKKTYNWMYTNYAKTRT